MPDTLIVLATIGSCFEQARACVMALEQCCDVPADLFVALDSATMEHDAWFCERGAKVSWALTQRRGIVGAYNAGFQYFLTDDSYQYLMLVEDGISVDDHWDTDMRRVLDNHPEFGWVACGQIENDKAPFTPLCSLMTRACAEAVKGLDPLFAPCQFDDADLFMRCLQAGFTPFAVNHKVSHPVSRTSREGTLEQDWALVLDHRDKFQRRWQIPDSPLHQVPVHTCERCK